MVVFGWWMIRIRVFVKSCLIRKWFYLSILKVIFIVCRCFINVLFNVDVGVVILFWSGNWLCW